MTNDILRHPTGNQLNRLFRIPKATPLTHDCPPKPSAALYARQQILVLYDSQSTSRRNATLRVIDWALIGYMPPADRSIRFIGICRFSSHHRG